MSSFRQPRTAGRLHPPFPSWSRTTTLLLIVVGLMMSLVSFFIVMSMPDLVWHPARDAELRATYDAYRETGTLLIKETGSGSYGVQSPADGPLTFATWDDDPGSYIIASLMSHITGSDSPYPGLKLAQALLVAIPLIWLPLAVARVVGRARAGFALLLLPLVTWLFNHGAALVGTEYGLSDKVSSLPVYSLYGTAASLAFLSLSLIMLASTYRLSMVALVGATVGIGVLAAFGNLSRSLSGIGIAAAVGVLWWIHARGRWRWLALVGGALVTILLAITIQTGVMAAINTTRVQTTGQPMEEVPDAHTAWHSLYLGLSYPQPINGQPSRFDVVWSDEFGWERAREVDPDVLVASDEYDQILRGLYFEEISSDPVGAVKLYVKKALYVAQHFGGLLLFIVIGFGIGLWRRSALRTRLGRVIAIATPLLLLGLVPAVLVMPMLYYFSELAAALGLLAAVSLGVVAWAVTSWPSRVRARERARLAVVATPRVNPDSDRVAVSAVLVEYGAGTLDRVAAVAHALTQHDEVIVVSTSSELSRPEEWPYPPALVCATAGAEIGDRFRTGVLASQGDHVLLVDPSGRDRGGAERTRFAGIPRKLVLGTKDIGEPRTLSVPGDWVREFAAVSRERDDLWIDELVFAADRARVNIERSDDSEPIGERSGFRFRGTGEAFAGFVRIAMRREEYEPPLTATRS